MSDQRRTLRATTFCLFLSMVVATGIVIDARAAEPSLADTIERVRHSIVAVGTSEPTRNPAFQFRGTGFAIGDGTLIATNDHVLPEGVDRTKLEVVSIAVPTRDGDAVIREATIVARDPEHDVSLLRIRGAPLAPLALGDAARVREGDGFAFTGFPIGSVIGLFPTTHHALVSAITPAALSQPNSRTLDRAVILRLRAERFMIFQLDATAYPGNSGSPMFDVATGGVVAIVNSTLVKAGKESALTQPSGISYAVPITYLERLVGSVRSAGDAAPGR